MTKLIARVTEKTQIPLYLAFTVFGGGAVWATRISVTMDAQAATLERVRNRTTEVFDDINKRLDTIEQHLAGIEGELKRMNR